jgi:hypothetical protein
LIADLVFFTLGTGPLAFVSSSIAFHNFSLLIIIMVLQHIAKQRLPSLAKDMIKKGKHFILIRSPLDVLVSDHHGVIYISFFWINYICLKKNIEKSMLYAPQKMLPQ